MSLPWSALVQGCERVLAAVLIALLVTSIALAADAYPVKPIRIIVPFPPGGLSDGLARILAQNLVQELGQQIIVDNRPGAGTTLAADVAAKSAADGYTLFFQDITTHGINAGLYRKLPYDSLKDFAPVAMASASPLVLSVHPSLPARSVSELVALAKARPQEINYGSSGNGAILHLAAELFKKTAHVDFLHVPYKGSPPAVTALLQGEVAVVFATTGSVLPHVQAGRVRALAVTTARRSPLLPNLPAIAETLPGYDLILYQGILAPGKTPREIVVKLNAELNKIMSKPGAKENWARLGAETVIVTPDEFDQRFRDEVAKLSRLAVESGARVD
jgi:tripartite-type tricarboxylate transporter receptor subunit TctC